MAKCSFCKINVEQGTGKMFVRNDGKIFYFCGSKCQKNMLMLRRVPERQNWITKKKKTKKT
ncbi:MAG: 50S ribosomal protein L24e [Candidatus Aenigmatarchaeota archaeon]